MPAQQQALFVSSNAMTHVRILILVIGLSLVFLGSVFGQRNPEYAATVGGEWSGTIRKGLFLAQVGVAASQKISLDHWERLQVDSFAVIVFRDGSMTFRYKNAGNTFQDSLRTRFKQLLVGDRILIFDIYATDLSKRKVLLQPLEYLIE